MDGRGGVLGRRRPGAHSWRAMPLPRAPLLLLGAVLRSFVEGGFCGSLAHSLCYSYLHLPEPRQGLPQFSIRSYLDDQPIARYDSLTRTMEPLVSWMEQKEEEEPFRILEWVIGTFLEWLSRWDHQMGGLHRWQAMLGCELREDGSKGGFFHYGYDGMDFLSFDKETLRWVAAQPQSQKVKEKIRPGDSQKKKTFLEGTCIECLQRYLSYRKEALLRIDPPVGKVTRKVVDDTLEVLVCQAFGFYPKDIKATWMRDGEIWENKTVQRNVVPNSDGTYYLWLSIEIDPKERDRFRCRLEHQGLQEPLILARNEETAPSWWIPEATVIAILLIFGIVLQCLKKRCRKKINPEDSTSSDSVIGEKLPSPTKKKKFVHRRFYSVKVAQSTAQPVERGAPESTSQCCPVKKLSL